MLWGYTIEHMNKQKGFAFIPVILAILGVLALGTAGVGVAAVIGKAPNCPNPGSNARTEKIIGDAIEKGSVTITDGEATTLAQSYIGNQISDARVCFTKGAGHVSGSINLNPVKPSFYLSSGADLTGSIPKITNLKIQLGSLPDIPAVSSLAEGAINQVISGALSKFELKQKYSVSFADGSMTIKK